MAKGRTSDRSGQELAGQKYISRIHLLNDTAKIFHSFLSIVESLSKVQEALNDAHDH
jgi:hypothetical protein